jgi:hypothetical protein
VPLFAALGAAETLCWFFAPLIRAVAVLAREGEGRRKMVHGL